jgi:hypothetical protein
VAVIEDDGEEVGIASDRDRHPSGPGRNDGESEQADRVPRLDR